MEENFQITPKFWADCAKDGTIEKLAGMMDTPTSGYEYANAPEIELYLNPDPDHTKYEIWLPIVRKEEVY